MQAVAARLDLPPSATHRRLNDLLRLGYVCQPRPQGDYALVWVAVAQGPTPPPSPPPRQSRCPVSKVRWPDGREAPFPHIIERGKPGVIAVLPRAMMRSFKDLRRGYMARYGR